MTVSLEGVYAVDAGVLIDLVYDTDEGKTLREAVLDESVSLLTHEYAVLELRYIICRRLGRDEAWARVEKLLASGYIIVDEASNLMEDAAVLKCERHISLPDCFTLALARKYKAIALFASREAELVREMEINPFKARIQFLKP